MTTTTKSPVNLFATGTKVKEATKKTPDKKTITRKDLADKIKKFGQLKEIIDGATGKLKMVEGDIKEVGRSIYMEEYQEQRSKPDNFKIADETGHSCMFICMDKYTLVDQIKAEVLSNYDNLLKEDIVYKFNAELVEKYGAVLSEMILNSDEIAEEDKANLITGEKSFSVQKGAIDRLMLYENPAEIFELINPICSLKK